MTDAELKAEIIHVKKIARGMAIERSCLDIVDDMTGYGMIGLMKAYNQFDPLRGVRFRTYAELRVRGAILDGMREMDVLSRDMRRRLAEAGVDRPVVSGDKWLAEVVDPHCNQEALTESEQMARRVRRMVASLNRKQKYPIAAYYWGEIDQEQIAKQLGVSYSTVVLRMREARKVLRHKLAA